MTETNIVMDERGDLFVPLQRNQPGSMNLIEDEGNISMEESVDGSSDTTMQTDEEVMSNAESDPAQYGETDSCSALAQTESIQPSVTISVDCDQCLPLVHSSTIQVEPDQQTAYGSMIKVDPHPIGTSRSINQSVSDRSLAFKSIDQCEVDHQNTSRRIMQSRSDLSQVPKPTDQSRPTASEINQSTSDLLPAADQMNKSRPNQSPATGTTIQSRPDQSLVTELIDQSRPDPSSVTGLTNQSTPATSPITGLTDQSRLDPSPVTGQMEQSRPDQSPPTRQIDQSKHDPSPVTGQKVQSRLDPSSATGLTVQSRPNRSVVIGPLDQSRPDLSPATGIMAQSTPDSSPITGLTVQSRLIPSPVTGQMHQSRPNPSPPTGVIVHSKPNQSPATGIMVQSTPDTSPIIGLTVQSRPNPSPVTGQMDQSRSDRSPATGLIDQSKPDLSPVTGLTDQSIPDPAPVTGQIVQSRLNPSPAMGVVVQPRPDQSPATAQIVQSSPDPDLDLSGPIHQSGPDLVPGSREIDQSLVDRQPDSRAVNQPEASCQDQLHPLRSLHHKKVKDLRNGPVATTCQMSTQGIAHAGEMSAVNQEIASSQCVTNTIGVAEVQTLVSSSQESVRHQQEHSSLALICQQGPRAADEPEVDHLEERTSGQDEKEFEKPFKNSNTSSGHICNAAVFKESGEQASDREQQRFASSDGKVSDSRGEILLTANNESANLYINTPGSSDNKVLSTSEQATARTYSVEPSTLDHLYEEPIAVSSIIRQQVEQLDHVYLNIAVTGMTGAGKSTFINAIRGVDSFDEKMGAPTGVTETTMEARVYPHPSMPNVHLWDLPGTGSPKFKVKKYFKLVNFDAFDFFIIISSERFRENDLLLAREIQKRKKKFYFLRSKIDNDIRAEERKRDFDEEKLLQQIREDCQNNLKNLVNPTVFLVSSFDLEKYDFPLLIETLSSDLPAHKRDALFLSLPVYSTAALERKIKTFEESAQSAAKAAAKVSMAPIPGLALAFDAGILLTFFTKCYNAFGLDDQSLDKLSLRVNNDSLKSLRDSKPLVMAVRRTELGSRELSALTSKRAALEFAYSLVPVWGSKKAAIMAHSVTLDLLLEGLKELADTARLVLREAKIDHVK